jgi:hypothetical protein
MRYSILMSFILLLLTVPVYMQSGTDSKTGKSIVSSVEPRTPPPSLSFPEVVRHVSKTNSASFFAKAPLGPTLCTWVGGTGNWDVPSNWSCDQVPTLENDVEILVGSVTVNVNADVKTLAVGSAASITINTGMTLVVHQ